MADWEKVDGADSGWERVQSKSDEGWEKVPLNNSSKGNGSKLKEAGSNVLGGMGALGQFAAQAISIPMSGIYGLAKGGYESLVHDKPFLPSVVEGVEKASDYMDVGRALNIRENPGYKTATEALAMPAEAGIQAMRGIQALGTAAVKGVDSAVEGLKHPENTPLTSTAQDVIGPLLGYGMAGKGIKRAGTDLAKIRERSSKETPYEKPAPLPEKVPEPLGPIPYPETSKKQPVKIQKSQKRTGMKEEDSTTHIKALESLSIAEEELNRQKAELDMPGVDFDINSNEAWKRDSAADPFYNSPNDFGIERTKEASEMFNQSREAIANREEDRIGRIEEDITRDLTDKYGTSPAQADREAGWRMQDADARAQARLENDKYEATKTAYENSKINDLTAEIKAKDERIKQRQAQVKELGSLTPDQLIKDLHKQIREVTDLKNQLREEMGKPTEPPNIQRSPNKRSKLGGVGKKQGGAVDPSILKEGIDRIGNLIDKLKESKRYQALNFMQRMEEILPLVNKQSDLLEKYNDIIEKQIKGDREKELLNLRKQLNEIGDVIEDLKLPSNVTRLNKGPGGKQSGGTNFGFAEWAGDKLSNVLKRGKNPKDPSWEPKGITQTIAAMLPAENRSIEQFVQDTLPAELKPGYFKDLSSSSMLGITPDNVASMAAKNENPFVSFINAKLNDIDRRYRTFKENALNGNSFVPNIRGWVKRVAGDDGAVTLYKKASKESQENIRRVANEWSKKSDELEAAGLDYPTDDMYAASGLSVKEVSAIRAMGNQFKILLDSVNKLLEKDGKAPIKFKPGYFPSVWEGDYRIFIRDSEGKTVSVLSANNKYQANYLRDQARKQFPELVVDDPQTVKQNKYSINDTSAFELIHEMIGDTPMGKIIKRFEEDVKAHRGYKRHGLMKKGVEGHLGSAVGDTKGFQKASEMYISSGYEFMADMERTLLQRDLYKALKEKGYNLKEELPKTDTYISNITANAKNAVASEMKLIDSAVEKLGDRAGLGPNAGRRTNSFLSGLASTAWLTTGKFVLINTLQPLMGMAKAHEISSKLNGGSVAAAYSRALFETYIPGMASAETKAALSYAKKEGMIDAKFVEMDGKKFFTEDLARRTVDTYPKHLLGVVEQETVRTLTFIAMNHILKDIIKDPKERWHTAGAATETTMIPYSRTQTPRLWARMGFVGEAVKPLKQYAMHTTGQLMDMTKTAISEKRPTPLLLFLGLTWVLAGAKGMAPLTMVNGVINSINSMLPDDMQLKTVEEHMIASGTSANFTFGPVSTYTGLNLSGSMAFPDPTQLGTAPGLEYAGGMVKQGLNLAIKGAQGNVTDMDKMNAELAVAPSMFHQAIKQSHALPGQGIPNPRTGISETEPRSDKDKLLANLTGAEPIQESIDKAKIRGYKKEEQTEEAKLNSIKKKFVNDFVVNGDINREKMDEFVQEGGDPKNISSSIKTWMKADLIDFFTREMLKAKGVKAGRVKERVDKFKDSLENASVNDLAEAWKETQ